MSSTEDEDSEKIKRLEEGPSNNFVDSPYSFEQLGALEQDIDINNILLESCIDNRLITELPPEPEDQPVCKKVREDIYVVRLPKGMKNLCLKGSEDHETASVTVDSDHPNEHTPNKGPNSLESYCMRKITEIAAECETKYKSSGRHATFYSFLNKLFSLFIIFGAFAVTVLAALSLDSGNSFETPYTITNSTITNSTSTKTSDSNYTTEITQMVITGIMGMVGTVHMSFSISTKGVEYKNKSIQLRKTKNSAEESLLYGLSGQDLLELFNQLRNEVDQIDLQLFELSNNNKNVRITSGDSED